MSFITYMIENHEQILSLFIEHVELTVIAVGFAIILGIPIGILISYVKKLNKPVLGVASVIQAIPSMALLGFAIPFFRNWYITSNCHGCFILITSYY